MTLSVMRFRKGSGAELKAQPGIEQAIRLGRAMLEAAQLLGAGLVFAPSLDEKLLLGEECVRHLRHVELVVSALEQAGAGRAWRLACPLPPPVLPLRRWSDVVIAHELLARIIDGEAERCARSWTGQGENAASFAELTAATREQAELAAEMLRELARRRGPHQATLEDEMILWHRQLAARGLDLGDHARPSLAFA